MRLQAPALKSQLKGSFFRKTLADFECVGARTGSQCADAVRYGKEVYDAIWPNVLRVNQGLLRRVEDGLHALGGVRGGGRVPDRFLVLSEKVEKFCAKSMHLGSHEAHQSRYGNVN
ncbi:hypothetical protein Acr_25g0002400 [Actinidia rufa]|uniref:Uncharacterized protein n=1 Tax=Actinidia rufa TaxID=165716 RepID=A0A7J0GYI0_9ERIC|nr:hypothetical protein Acr_25g0002400 [Actinidia rufa]